MTTRLLTVIIFLTTIACNQKTDRKTETADCTPYFTFDQVEYYSISISEDSVFNLEEKEPKTIDEDRLTDLLIRDKPDILSAP
jgi:hypothetical protein